MPLKPFAQLDASVIHDVAGRRHGGGSPDRRVGQIEPGLRLQEVLDRRR
jgi:hypothetical protein